MQYKKRTRRAVPSNTFRQSFARTTTCRTRRATHLLLFPRDDYTFAVQDVGQKNRHPFEIGKTVPRRERDRYSALNPFKKLNLKKNRRFYTVFHDRRHGVPAVCRRGSVRVFRRPVAAAPATRRALSRRRGPSFLDRYSRNNSSTQVGIKREGLSFTTTLAALKKRPL